MRGRPPKKTLTKEQERAASAFVEAAESPGSGSGRTEAVVAPVASGTKEVLRRRATASERPWEADFVREDVTKGYALRLPEPLYLKLKWMAEQTGRSVNTVIREVIEDEVESFLRESG